MEVIEKLIFRILMLCLLYQSGIGRIPQAQTSPGFIRTSCFSSMFWLTLDQSFLQKRFTRIEIVDPSGVIVQLDDKLKARCGYVVSKDVWGNTIFRASLLGCHVINEMDERFSLTVNIKVSSFEDMTAATSYQHRMRCSYFPWAPREIVCEENYMEVSVKTDVPGISDDEPKEWMSALPEAQSVVYRTWQLVFNSPSGIKTTVASDADKLGYSFNNTLARVFLRSPYSTNETEYSVSTVSNGIYGVIYSIDLFMELAWTDQDWHLTKYTVMKPITTPFMPRILTVFN
ncbi:3-deoxy-manno-octulosonate cytidylyltransferase, partial [Varanus komodoensis]